MLFFAQFLSAYLCVFRWIAVLAVSLTIPFGSAAGQILLEADQKDAGFRKMQVVRSLSLDEYLQGLAWSSDGSKLATLSSFGRLVTIWDAKSWKKVREISQYAASFAGSAIAWTKDGKILTSAGAKAPNERIVSMNLWDPSTGLLVKQISGPPIPEGTLRQNQAADFSLSRSGSLLAMTSLQNADVLVIYNTSDWSIRQIIRIAAPPSAQVGRARSFSFSPDEKFIAIANGRYIQAIDLRDASIKFSILAYESSGIQAGPIIASLKYSPDGLLLVSAPIFFPSVSGDHSPIRLWSSSDGAQVGRLAGAEASIRMVDWDLAGTRLAAAGVDRVVRVWKFDQKAEAGRLIFELPEASAGVVAFSNDGALAAGSEKSVLIIR